MGEIDPFNPHEERIHRIGVHLGLPRSNQLEGETAELEKRKMKLSLALREIGNAIWYGGERERVDIAVADEGFSLEPIDSSSQQVTVYKQQAEDYKGRGKVYTDTEQGGGRFFKWAVTKVSRNAFHWAGEPVKLTTIFLDAETGRLGEYQMDEHSGVSLFTFYPDESRTLAICEEVLSEIFLNPVTPRAYTYHVTDDYNILHDRP